MANFRRASFGVLFVVLCVACSIAFGQSDIDVKSDEIIDRCIEAMGSSMELKTIDSYLISGRILIDGQPQQDVSMKVKGNRTRALLAGRMDVGTNGKHSWFAFGDTENKLVDSPETIPPSECYPLPSTVLGWRNFDGTVRYIGDEYVEGAVTQHVEFECRSGAKIQRFFDRKSSLLIAQSTGITNKNEVAIFEYSIFGNCKLISRERRSVSKQEIEFTYDLNARFDDSVFEIPAEVQKQIAQIEQRNDESR